jgi:hypothetical protein
VRKLASFDQRRSVAEVGSNMGAVEPAVLEGRYRAKSMGAANEGDKGDSQRDSRPGLMHAGCAGVQVARQVRRQRSDIYRAAPNVLQVSVPGPYMEVVKRAVQALAGLSLWLALAGCVAAQGSGRTTWKEEVLLHDGRVLIVERSQSYGGRREPGQSAPVREHSVTFRPPGSERLLTWASEYSEDVGRANFNLVALHIKEATPYVIASPNLCLSYNKWGRPNPPYVVFRYDGTQWQRISTSALPTEFTEVNVVVTPGTAETEEMGKSAFVSAAEVRRRNSSFRVSDEYRSILREPVPEGAPDSITSCQKLVRYKCGWGAPGEFNRKYFESICK